MRACALLVALPLAALLLGGCVERKFMVHSRPAGATVLVNGAVAGSTPTEIPFHHYGTVRVEILPLDADGDGWIDFRRAVVNHELRSPWYQWFPIDFVADNLLPWTWEDRHDLFVPLEPALNPDAAADVEEMRARTRTLRIRSEKARAEAEAGAGTAEPGK